MKKDWNAPEVRLLPTNETQNGFYEGSRETSLLEDGRFRSAYSDEYICNRYIPEDDGIGTNQRGGPKRLSGDAIVDLCS